MVEEKTIAQLQDVFLRALLGQNFSDKTVQAYGNDLSQFVEWVRGVRVDADLPSRMAREDVEGFMHHLLLPQAHRGLQGPKTGRNTQVLRLPR